MVAVAIALAMSAKVEPEALEPDVWAYLFAVGLGALMLVRRRWPAGVLVVTMVLLFAYYTDRLSRGRGGGAGRRRGLLGGGAGPGAAGDRGLGDGAGPVHPVPADRGTGGPAARVRRGAEPGAAGGRRSPWATASGPGASCAGNHSMRAEQASLITSGTPAQQVEQERLRIAREVHDVLAHSVSAISIQSVVAWRRYPHEPDNAAAALRSIRQVSTRRWPNSAARSACCGTRRPSRLAPVGGLADLDRLVATAAESGLQVAVSTVGPGRRFRWSSTRRRTGSCRNRSPTCCGIRRRCGRVEIDYRPSEVRLRIAIPLAASRADSAERTSQRCKGFRHRRHAGAGRVAGRDAARRPHRGWRVRGDAVLPYPVGPVRRADRRAAFRQSSREQLPMRPLAEQS